MGLTETLVAEPPPLWEDRDGVVRVGGTRVTLDTVVEAYEEGATPEEIVLQYSSLKLSDVYATLGYFLNHRAAVEAYLSERRRHAEEVRRQNEAHFPSQGIRERLLARRNENS